MDPVTHACFGALASKTLIHNSKTENGTSSQYLPVTVATIAAVFPDSDYLLFPFDPLLFLDEWHRSYTHSFVLLPLWTILLAGFMVFLFPRLRKHWLVISGFIALGLASHILLDILTVYGTRIFYPLSNHSFSLGTTFVIDPYLSLIILLGLLISFFRSPRITAIVFITILCLYLSFQWHLKSRALEIGASRFSQSKLADTEIAALPQPFSPFHWRIINQESNRYTTALIDLAGLSEKLEDQEGTIPFIEFVSAYRDIANARWEDYSQFGHQSEQHALVKEVWQQNGMTHFRSFAMYPVLYRVDRDDRQTCVWFSDLRYHISIMIPSFRFGMCREKNRQWQRYWLKYHTLNGRYAMD